MKNRIIPPIEPEKTFLEIETIATYVRPEEMKYIEGYCLLNHISLSEFMRKAILTEVYAFFPEATKRREDYDYIDYI